MAWIEDGGEASAKYIVYEKEAAGWATITWPLWCDNTRNVSSFAAIKTKQKHNYFLNSMALFSFKSSSVCHVCWLVDCWYANFLQMFLTYRCKIVVVPTPLEVRCNFANNFAGYMVGKINGHNPKPGLTTLKKIYIETWGTDSQTTSRPYHSGSLPIRCPLVGPQ